MTDRLEITVDGTNVNNVRVRTDVSYRPDWALILSVVDKSTDAGRCVTLDQDGIDRLIEAIEQVRPKMKTEHRYVYTAPWRVGGRPYDERNFDPELYTFETREVPA